MRIICSAPSNLGCGTCHDENHITNSPTLSFRSTPLSYSRRLSDFLLYSIQSVLLLISLLELLLSHPRHCSFGKDLVPNLVISVFEHDDNDSMEHQSKIYNTISGV